MYLRNSKKYSYLTILHSEWLNIGLAHTKWDIVKYIQKVHFVKCIYGITVHIDIMAHKEF